jgi:hypothetical protein
VSLRGLGLRLLALGLLILAGYLFAVGDSQLALITALGGLATYLAARVAP